MKTLITAKLDKNYLDEIKKLTDISFAGWGKTHNKLGEDEFIDLLKDKDILIVGYDPVTAKVINNAEKLKLIICTRSNPVNIDIEAAKENEIPVVNTPGRNSDTTAEYTVAMALNIARNIPMAHKALKEGKYLKESDNKSKKEFAGLKEDVTWSLGPGSPYLKFKGSQLKNKIFGIIGLGKIGRKVADLIRAFGMNIYIYDPYVSEVEVNDNVQEKVSLEKLLKKSDFISCHTAVTEETRGLIGKQEFELMKDSAYLINTSRGAIIDETALIEALRNNKIKGAALDVYESEPLADNHPFVNELDNIIITPHLGGATYEVITNHTKMAINEIKRFLKNEKLLYQYN